MTFTQRLARKLCRACGLEALPRETTPEFYASDGLWTRHNHEFMDDPKFRAAYARGVEACSDNKMYWRVHLSLWVAANASRLEGDFVECGVNAGFVSSAVMHSLDWNRLNKHFYLLDTFAGIDPKYVTAEEIAAGKLTKNDEVLRAGGYATNVERVRANFSEWHNVHVIQGSVPETLTKVDAAKIAYLHLDMNNVVPEVAATEFFWSRMSPGGFILYDDYTYAGYRPQKVGIDELMKKLGGTVLSLPTGQGLLIKPSRG